MIIRADLSVRPKFKPLRDIQVTATGSSNFPPGTVEQVAEAVDEFHQTVYTKWEPGRLIVRHGEMSIFGNVVVQSDEYHVKFKPEPGC